MATTIFSSSGTPFELTHKALARAPALAHMVAAISSGAFAESRGLTLASVSDASLAVIVTHLNGLNGFNGLNGINGLELIGSDADAAAVLPDALEPLLALIDAAAYLDVRAVHEPAVARLVAWLDSPAAPLAFARLAQPQPQLQSQPLLSVGDNEARALDALARWPRASLYAPICRAPTLALLRLRWLLCAYARREHEFGQLLDQRLAAPAAAAAAAAVAAARELGRAMSARDMAAVWLALASLPGRRLSLPAAIAALDSATPLPGLTVAITALAVVDARESFCSARRVAELTSALARSGHVTVLSAGGPRLAPDALLALLGALVGSLGLGARADEPVGGGPPPAPRRRAMRPPDTAPPCEGTDSHKPSLAAPLLDIVRRAPRAPRAARAALCARLEREQTDRARAVRARVTRVLAARAERQHAWTLLARGAGTNGATTVAEQQRQSMQKLPPSQPPPALLQAPVPPLMPPLQRAAAALPHLESPRATPRSTAVLRVAPPLVAIGSGRLAPRRVARAQRLPASGDSGWKAGARRRYGSPDSSGEFGQASDHQRESETSSDGSAAANAGDVDAGENARVRTRRGFVLRLEGCALDARAAKRLARVCAGGTLTRLMLSDTSALAPASAPLCTFVRYSPVLAHLALVRCALSASAMTAVLDAASYARVLATLELAGNHAGGAGGAAIGTAAAALVLRSPSVTALDLSANAIGTLGARAVLHAAARSPGLARIALAHTGLAGGTGTADLLAALGDSRSLVYLALGGNAMCACELAAGALAQLLVRTRTLVTLRLDDAPMCPAGVLVALARGLGSAPSLRTLSLSVALAARADASLSEGTGVGAGADASAGSGVHSEPAGTGRQNQTVGALYARLASASALLEHLTLDGAPLGAVGARALADAILQQPALVSLSVRYCGIGALGAGALAAALAVRTRPLALELAGNFIEHESESAAALAALPSPRRPRLV